MQSGNMYSESSCTAGPTNSQVPEDTEAPKRLQKGAAQNIIQVLIAVLAVAILFTLCGFGLHKTVALEKNLEEIKANFEADTEAIKFSFHNLSGRWDSNFTNLNSAVKEIVTQYENVKRTVEFILEYDDWDQVGRFFYKLFKSSATYATARKYCENFGARLASVGIRNETAKRLIIERWLAPGGRQTWIGSDDLQQSSRWIWSDGVVAIPNWCPGEPNMIGHERCAEVVPSAGWCLNNVHCTSRLYFLCEISLDKIGL